MKTLNESLLVDEASAHDFSETAFNFIATFKFMNQRRMQRQFQGVYPGPSKVMALLAQIVWLYALVVVLLASAMHAPAQQATIESTLLTLAALIAVQIVAQQVRSRLLLLMAYCAVVAHATFFAIFNDAGLFEIARGDSFHPHRLYQSKTLISLVIAESAILFAYLALYHIYPFVITHEWIDTNKWFALQRGRRANTITYKAISLHRLWASRHRYTIEYTGGLDNHFRPHGYGIWKDSSYHGETLVGAWEHGIPIGPFTSREHGSGFASQQVRVAYGMYRAEEGTNEMHFVPKFPEDKKIRWGVARMECSVAGGFFKFLPRVEHFFDRANAPQSAAKCVETLRTPLDNVFYRDTETHEIVSDHAMGSSQYRESIEPTTLSKLEQKMVRPQREKEALVFIHGIFNSLDDAIKLCGQLLSRGDFPSEIHPFVFSWASGNYPVPSYWFAKQRAESDEVASALQTFVASILEAGYTKVHFITHSMGTRVFLNTVERNSFKSLFRNGTSTASAMMGTVSLCSPEFPLARFVAAGGVYDVLREYCTHITIYGDKWDLALRGSELANRDTSLCSPLVLSLGCRVNSVVRDASFPSPRGCKYVSAGEFNTSVGASEATASLATINQAAGFRQVTSVAQNCDPQPAPEPAPTPASYGSLLDYAEDDADSNAAKPLVYLDVDVINTSFADSNVGNRHSYFRVNESIVEDIRDLILHKRRARGRAGLMRQRGNVFIFLTAPKDVI